MFFLVSQSCTCLVALFPGLLQLRAAPLSLFTSTSFLFIYNFYSSVSSLFSFLFLSFYLNIYIYIYRVSGLEVYKNTFLCFST